MAEILKSDKKFGLAVNFHDFGQKMFEQYQNAFLQASKEAYYAFSPTGGVSAQASIRGETVRAAIQFGIISGIDVKEVDQMKPYVVEWLANQIQAHVKSVVTAPADPN